jgi:hypothetical protein
MSGQSPTTYLLDVEVELDKATGAIVAFRQRSTSEMDAAAKGMEESLQRAEKTATDSMQNMAAGANKASSSIQGLRPGIMLATSSLSLMGETGGRAIGTLGLALSRLAAFGFSGPAIAITALVGGLELLASHSRDAAEEARKHTEEMKLEQEAANRLGEEYKRLSLALRAKQAGRSPQEQAGMESLDSVNEQLTNQIKNAKDLSTALDADKAQLAKLEWNSSDAAAGERKRLEARVEANQKLYDSANRDIYELGRQKQYLEDIAKTEKELDDLDSKKKAKVADERAKTEELRKQLEFKRELAGIQREETDHAEELRGRLAGAEDPNKANAPIHAAEAALEAAQKNYESQAGFGSAIEDERLAAAVRMAQQRLDLVTQTVAAEKQRKDMEDGEKQDEEDELKFIREFSEVSRKVAEDYKKGAQERDAALKQEYTAEDELASLRTGVPTKVYALEREIAAAKAEEVGLDGYLLTEKQAQVAALEKALAAEKAIGEQKALQKADKQDESAEKKIAAHDAAQQRENSKAFAAGISRSLSSTLEQDVQAGSFTGFFSSFETEMTKVFLNALIKAQVEEPLTKLLEGPASSGGFIGSLFGLGGGSSGTGTTGPVGGLHTGTEAGLSDNALLGDGMASGVVAKRGRLTPKHFYLTVQAENLHIEQPGAIGGAGGKPARRGA